MKYIIDVPCELIEDDGLLTFRSPYADVLTDIHAEPYTEPDRKDIEDEVWELADCMCRMGVKERDLCFGFQLTTEVTANLTYQEAKSKFEAWLKQKDEIHVGDEVTHTKGYKGIVTYINCELCDVLWDDGCVTEDVYKKEFFKTGRHFDEVADLLEKMRGEEE